MKLPSFYLSHGGGPWPYMSGPMRDAHRELEAELQALPGQLRERPKAVLLVTAHWETRQFTVSAGTQPGMLYDYGGFPPETYTVQYPAPGSPELARHVQTLAQAAGIACELDTVRGYDHGTFVPMHVMYPAADMPLVQMSIRADFDPLAHLEMGRALAPLREQGVLIIGSGFSYHARFAPSAPGGQHPSAPFDQWLNTTLTTQPPAERWKRVVNWASAPGARVSQPREDHLIPLMVALGSAENEPGERSYSGEIFCGALVSNFRFGQS
jgi:aromatic ring-opening dioxygenase catalytic subunit (LigB family)